MLLLHHTVHLLDFLPLQISREFRRLKPVFQEVISDITQRMGSGMCVFLENQVDSMAQWDEVFNVFLTVLL